MTNDPALPMINLEVPDGLRRKAALALAAGAQFAMKRADPSVRHQWKGQPLNSDERRDWQEVASILSAASHEAGR